jgi:hypothetical protein
MTSAWVVALRERLHYCGGETWREGPFTRPRRKWEYCIKWIFNKENGGIVLHWNYTAEDMNKWRAVLTSSVNLLVPWNAGNFSTSWGIIFAIMILLYGIIHFEYISNFLGFFAFYFFSWHCGPKHAMASSFLKILDHTQQSTTMGRTPLDEWSARHKDLYLTTHNTHNRETSMPAISAGERPQTHTLDRADPGTGEILVMLIFRNNTKRFIAVLKNECFLCTSRKLCFKYFLRKF